MNNNQKQLDSYSMLIVSKYLEISQDYINIICINSKFKETTEKMRYNPIPITSLKLFPKIQTQYLYSRSDKKIKRKNQIKKYELWYEIDYQQYLKQTKDNTICHYVQYTKKNRLKFGDKILNGITSIGEKCFFNSNLETIDIPNGVTILSDSSFEGCEFLTSISIPKSLKIFGDKCFCNCSSLKTITIPNSIQSIPDFLFFECHSLEQINIPNTVTLLGDYCFWDVHH